MKILAETKDLFSCTIYVQSNMTKQSHQDSNNLFEITRFCIYLEVGKSANDYAI